MLCNDWKFCINLSNFALHLILAWYFRVCFSIPGPECISCNKNNQVFNKDGEFQYCDSNKTGTREDLITGLVICEDGQVKDTRGECKIAYKFSPPKEEKDVQKRENQKPRRPRDLKKYLQSRYRF
mgnify:CR=1 FL=1